MFPFFWLFKQIFYLCKKSIKIILLIVIFILIFMYCSKVFGYQSEILTDGSTTATIVPTQDMYSCLEFTYNSAEVIILSALDKAYSQGRTTLVNNFLGLIDQGYYIYYDYFSSGRIVAFFYKPSANPIISTMQESTYGTFAFNSLQCIYINKASNDLVWIDYMNGNLGELYYYDTDNSYPVPHYLYSVRTELLSQYYLKYKYPSTSNIQNYSSALSNIQNTLNQQSTYLQQNIQATQQTTQAVQQTTQAVNEATNAINDLNDTIKDDNVATNDIDLPSDSSTDITANGVDGIFTSIYNAFCTGNAQDIVFPVPFTGKNITLQANYVRNMLSNSGATWVITIIEAFWWYLISRFIIKDIVNKITKIKGGNLEAIEETNIKGDML